MKKEKNDTSIKVPQRTIVKVNSNKVFLNKDSIESIRYVCLRNPDGTPEKKFEQAATADATGHFAFSGKELIFFVGDIEDGKEVVVLYYKKYRNLIYRRD